ncbi:hypothetical protein ACHAPT_011186 [Fusarium lateritium]
MESLKRNESTAVEARQLENLTAHPMRKGESRDAAYFEMLRARRDKLMTAQVLVVVAHTGTGKTTQIPQFVLFDEWESGLKVACTQPRRLAASSVARRVAQEMAVPLGQEVGYHVRFDARKSTKTDETDEVDETRLLYMTDGMLLAQAKSNPTFSGYSCIIIDEAHERTTATDILMALLKHAISLRKDLKVVIMSATMNAAKFQNFFGGAKSLEVAGRTFPVAIHYLADATPHYGRCALLFVKHEKMGPGDILVFLPSVNETERFCSESGSRKCIVATNVAENSLTIDGVVYVVDTGLVKQAGFNPRAGLNRLYTAAISKDSAKQRAGRAGRTQPGVCFRLYTEETFDKVFLTSTPPGMLKQSLTSEILMLKSMGFNAVGLLDWIDRPHSEVYYHGLEDLFHMGYIDESAKITSKGRRAARLPMDPVWYNAMAEANTLGCLAEIVSIAAPTAAQSQHSILRPQGYRIVANAARRMFACPVSDHIAQLNALHAFCQARAKQAGRVDLWCRNRFLNRRVLEETLKVREHLVRIAKEFFGTITGMDCGDGEYDDKICKALARSMFCNVAIRDPGSRAAKGNGPIVENEGDLYRTVHRNHHAALHPDSGLIGIKHEWVVFDKFAHRGKEYQQTVTAIKPEWVIDLPYFQDDRLTRKRNDLLRQPYVKASLDQAREKAAAPA